MVSWVEVCTVAFMVTDSAWLGALGVPVDKETHTLAAVSTIPQRKLVKPSN